MADQRVGEPHEERWILGLGAARLLTMLLVVMTNAKNLAGVRD
jgi:hypothetical protein